jgi:hypothetical protein
MTNLIQKLKAKVERAIEVYMGAIDNRSTRATYVFGQRTSTVKDARRDYTQKMRSYLELARQLKCKEVENLILGMFDDDEDEDYLKKEAKK